MVQQIHLYCNWKKKCVSISDLKHKKKLTPDEKRSFSVNGSKALPHHNCKATNIIMVGIRRKREYEGIKYYNNLQSYKHFRAS